MTDIANAPKAATTKKPGLKERYALMTRGLDWETTYQPMSSGSSVPLNT